MFHNFVICASPFPPVFGLFFAPTHSFAAAAGLPLRLFARKVEKTPHRDHPRAPRRRMCRKKVIILIYAPFHLFPACFSPSFPSCRRCWLTFEIVCSTGGKDTASRPFESSPTPTAEEKGEKSKILLIANTTRTLGVTTAKVSFLYTSRARELRQ